ncbi:ATP-dependent zinc metalloprotease FtsH [Abditibacteriota bacterium]|nr:ATP-dependent zinc metalloprotease FtsH [Abditibacteriota bacterium]
MANPLRDFFFGTLTGQSAPKKELTDALTPRRSFADVILPASTRQQLEYALVQIKKSDLIFGTWGLGERHASGLGLAFNFAGPPGTGKTICAEAVAFEIGKRLLIVRYAEMESLWAGETSKNVAAVFRLASETDAVLFFDEADAIATRRFGSVTQGYQREANAVVNVLLKELEDFDGVVIFATNLASNFDPAFERRIRTHILFEMPDAPAREQIWKVQLHARKTPLADDVDFAELGERYAVAGGDIKNAVLKAAQIASAEPMPDSQKQIHQRHFIAGIEEVLKSKSVMEQSIMDGDGSHKAAIDAGTMGQISAAFSQLAQNQNAMGDDLRSVTERSEAIEMQLVALPELFQNWEVANTAARTQMRDELVGQIEKSANHTMELRTDFARADERINNALTQTKLALIIAVVGILVGIGGIVTAFLH